MGPLTNPAGVKFQLTGAYSRDLIRPMALTLGQLGSKRAWLVHGSDGTDELAISGISWVSQLNEDGSVDDFETHPEEFGLPEHDFKYILGGSPAENTSAFKALLEGEISAYRDAVLLNSAAALLVAGVAEDKKQAVEMARESIDSKAAKQKIEMLARATSEAK